MAEKIGNQNRPNRRRNSTGQEKSSNAKIPIHLRASTGSCHDFCKYGGGKLFDDAKTKIYVQGSGKKKNNTPVGKNSGSEISPSSPKQCSSKSRFLNHGQTVLLRKPSVNRVTVMAKQVVLSKNQRPSVAGNSKQGNRKSCMTLKSDHCGSCRIKYHSSPNLDTLSHSNSLLFPPLGEDNLDSKDNKQEWSFENCVNREIEGIKSHSNESSSPSEFLSTSPIFLSHDLNERDFEGVEEPGTPDNGRYQKTEHSIAYSIENSSPSKSPSQDEIEQDSEEDEPTKVTKTSMTGKFRLIRAHNEVPSPVKLKFRRGKIIDAQRVGGNVLSRKSYGKRIIEGDHHHHKIGDPEKIVLRHQDAEGKKDDNKGLFNDMIEETANKLAETRKSKVKALVGAFETVISLQDK